MSIFYSLVIQDMQVHIPRNKIFKYLDNFPSSGTPQVFSDEKIVELVEFALPH